MSEPMACQSFICDSFDQAIAIAERLEARYPQTMRTAVAGRVLSVGVVSWADETRAQLPETVRFIYRQLRGERDRDSV